MAEVRIVLSEEEWDSLCDREREDEHSQLARCCSNISALRDSIIAIRENNGVMNDALRDRLRQSFAWCTDTHDFNYWHWTVLKKFIGQAGLAWPVPV